VIGQIWNRLQLLFAHGVGLRIGADKVQARVLSEEPLSNLNRIEPYGFSYRPKPGCQTYLLFPSGDRSYGVAIVIGDKRYQADLVEGEVALHDDQGQKVHLTRDGIVIDGAGKPVTYINTPKVRMETQLLEVTGEVKDRCDSSGRTMSGMRALHDSHTHHENDAHGETNTPTQKME
jgi:phage gp45-like